MCNHQPNVYSQMKSSRKVSPINKAGAIIHEDLSIADVILGVKEVPIKDLIPHKTYFYFSHTHKGQTYNMPMLKSVLDKSVRLVDYELITNESGRRLVQFSRFAGYAGMVDSFHVLGHRLLALGFGTPFMVTPSNQGYRHVTHVPLSS
jgi:alpha-aminoadipic semialdehyde synthase